MTKKVRKDWEMICFGKSKVAENVLCAFKNYFVEIFNVSRLEIYHDGRVGLNLYWDLLLIKQFLIWQVMMEILLRLLALVDWKPTMIS